MLLNTGHQLMMWKTPKARLISPEEKLSDGRHKNGTSSLGHHNIISILSLLPQLSNTNSFFVFFLSITFKCTFFWYREIFMPRLHCYYFLFPSLSPSLTLLKSILQLSLTTETFIFCSIIPSVLTPIDVLLLALR